MLSVFRICKTKYAATAFDGEGAYRFGGRWNSRGTSIPLENNYLLNPGVPDFQRITFGEPEKFVFDARLKRK